MDITFSIEYRAQWGQKLCITGSIVELGNWDEGIDAIELTATSDDQWEGTVSIDGRRKDFVYYYFVKNESGFVERREWKRMHHMLISEPLKTMFIDDRWIDRPPNSPFYSSSFYNVLFRHVREHFPEVKRTKEKEKLHFQIYAPAVPCDMRLYVTGSTPKLGQWNPEKALPLFYIDKGEWTCTVEIDPCSKDKDFYFKFFIADKSRQNIRWETSENRRFKLKPAGKYDMISIVGLYFEESHYAPHFAGVVAPLFALRSENDFGVGDFGTLKLFIDWARSASLHLVQMLPINDTTFYWDERDSYPYNVTSVNSLHPIYLDICALPPLRHPEEQDEFMQRAARLRQLPQMDYEAVLKLKQEFFHVHFKEQAGKVTKKRPYRDFCIDNAEWLLPYCAYCVLRDDHPHTPPAEWDEKARFKDISDIYQWLEYPENKDKALYYSYLQFVLAQQLSEVSEYAAHCGVLLKGDIPIGVSPNGVDAWMYPELFHKDRQAGAPPDDFATEGQNWGFPTYNWYEGEKDNFRWWRHRFRFMSQYFNAFRIDHILGFFRIWEIPDYHTSGLLGHFNPALPYSVSQIREYGFTFDEKLFTLPLIHRDDLKVIFGDNEKALIWKGWISNIPGTDFYTPINATQRYYNDVEPKAIPGGKKTLAAMQQACCEVLFVVDPDDANRLHPRVALEKSLLFARLSQEDREAWRKIDLDFYFNRNNDLWRETALKRLILMHQSTDMLVCAEDLGMIPPCVPEVLNELQVLTLELERMPKMYSESGLIDLQTLPYYSVCTTSTHDMPPLRLWWQKQKKQDREVYLRHHIVCSSDLSHEYEYADKLFHRIVYNHLCCPSMLVILPLSDWMAIDKRLHLQTPEDEQINHPDNPRQVWNYRMPITLEQLRRDYAELPQEITRLLNSIQRE